MKSSTLFLILFLGVTVPSGSCAIDPGTATGTLTIGNNTIPLTHSFAHLHDNAEGWLDTPHEMRILVTDRDLDEAVLAGMNPIFTLSDMVRQGSVRGVLLRFDPGKPNTVRATVLYPPEDRNHPLTHKKLGDGKKSPLEKLRISEVRVSAAMSQSSEGNQNPGSPAERYRFTFSAPLFREPAVTATMKGTHVLNSPQAKAFLARAAALVKGDLEKVRHLSTERSIRQLDMTLSQLSRDEAATMMHDSGTQMERAVRKGKLKLIVRGDRASLLVEEPDGTAMYGFIKKNGTWLVE